jgi:hypothetical protein
VYRSLNPALIVQTCRDNQTRIADRFPGSGLSKVAGELLVVSESASDLSAWLARPHLPLRALAGLGILAVFVIVAALAMSLRLQFTVSSVTEFIQSSESAISEVVFIGVAVLFLLSLETRRKRKRAMRAIHELRSLAHIIDMHQLTKDPERIVGSGDGGAAAVKRPQNPAELIRYLDYCSDMLALISKIAALYVQDFDDPVTLGAVNDVESLTNGLSRKIWQKIMIFDRILAPR